MNNRELHAVTGAFGYSGKYIARQLLDRGRKVITLTNSLSRPNPFGERVKAFPLAFDDPDRLRKLLADVDVLYNTYWVRFNHATFTHAQAIENTLTLFGAARKAGVRRIVHVSITNPDERSSLEYFSGKARLEQALIESGVSHAILRPTVLFGIEDILINNIAWALRRFPVFAVFGDGRYKLQPIYVEDLAKVAVDQGAGNSNSIVNAIGPETFTYDQLVEAISAAIGVRRRVVHVSPGVGYLMSRLIGMAMRDTFITRDEIQGLMEGRLCVDTAPVGTIRLTDWMRENASVLGGNYASELGRRADSGRSK